MKSIYEMLEEIIRNVGSTANKKGYERTSFSTTSTSEVKALSVETNAFLWLDYYISTGTVSVNVYDSVGKTINSFSASSSTTYNSGLSTNTVTAGSGSKTVYIPKGGYITVKSSSSSFEASVTYVGFEI